MGAPKALRDELYRSWDYHRFFSEYRESIADKSESLGKLLAIVRNGSKLALLCFERDPEKCHRKIVAEEVQKLDGNGLKAFHIMPI
ncbi:MAG: DUF488 domain-containing protein [Desulfobacterales bacterium]|nr:DUF488 domain-containing protein [Desulfobacterales bacterium]